ncbi:type II secretion system F family protein [Fructobacillus evanidus]|uniref:Component PulF (PulF) n=1 Tax=Fructobacillus evanidus TaxID=3064281 RepID=A0ABN9YM53_9LACO|nr:Type II secretory pathway [Fructobacillus sp. LMG 32999]CAK1231571.1 Type II secretory pathway [Fructobacillus sp. LMG 32999]CAK1233006.1 Type II secretory pathway [Fructobacillus sp. LMG 32999]CAK1235571.1 Type II secretory pathway [Fructobacillus sp. LMG 32999]CAK1238927.1 Type II secretory pathway [Fructobacillus sp. LMG 32999]
MHPKRKIRFSESDQVLFLAELGELTASGYALSLSLDVLASAHPSWQERLQTIRGQLEHGQPLAASLGKVLSPSVGIYLDLGQSHGNFDQTLTALASNFDQVLRYKQKLRQILTYPVILLVFLLSLVVGMETYLYPIFHALSAGQKGGQGTGENPALFYLHGLAFLFGFALVMIVVLIFLLRRLAPLQRIQVATRVPFLGSLMQTLLTYLLAEHLGILLLAGHTLPNVIDRFAALSAKKNGLVVAIAKRAQDAVQNGQTLQNWIGNQSYLKKPLATYLDRGFTGPVLGTYLTYYAKSEFQRFDRQVSRLLGLIQPLFFALIGLTIVLLYLAMLLPLYKNLGGMSI